MRTYKLDGDAWLLSEEPHETYGFSWRAKTHDSPLQIQWSSKSKEWLDDMTIVAEKSEEKTAQSSGKKYIWLTGVKKTDEAIGQESISGSQVEESAHPLPQAIKEPKPQAAAVSKDNKYLRDISGTYITIYNGSLNYAKELGLNLITNEEDRRVYYEYVKEVSEELIDWVTKARE